MFRTPPRRSAARRGFTMVEIIMVLAVAGLIASIAAPMFSPGRWRSDSALQELVMGLNSAQRLAVLRQHDVVVTFLTAERRIRVHQDENNDGATDAGEDVRVVELPETIGFGQGAAPDLAPGTGPVTFAALADGPTLTFHRNGSASESGAAYLRPIEGSMSLDVEAIRGLTVQRSTAQIRCFSYRTGSWESAC